MQVLINKFVYDRGVYKIAIKRWRIGGLKPHSLLLLGLTYKGDHEKDWSSLMAAGQAEQSAHERARIIRLLP